MLGLKVQDRHLSVPDPLRPHVDVQKAFRNEAEDTLVVVRIRRYVEPALKLEKDVKEPDLYDFF